jgi:hypothetical protein
MDRFILFGKIMLPGVAESMINTADVHGNLFWHGIAKMIKVYRNVTYGGILLTLSPLIGVPSFISILGASFVSLGVWRLQEPMKTIIRAENRKD